MSGKGFLGFSFISLLAVVAIYAFLMGREEGSVVQIIKTKNKIDLAECLVKYQNPLATNCIPGDSVDGLTEMAFYLNKLNLSEVSETTDKSISDDVREASVAIYSNSPSICESSWRIKEDGKWKEVNLSDFCGFVVDYNTDCDGCLLEWE